MSKKDIRALMIVVGAALVAAANFYSIVELTWPYNILAPVIIGVGGIAYIIARASEPNA